MKESSMVHHQVSIVDALFPLSTISFFFMLLLGSCGSILYAQELQTPLNPPLSGGRLFPLVDQLPIIEELPDPFVMRDGSHVQTKEQWAQRRDEIKELIQYYQYGQMPPPPGNVRAENIQTGSIHDGLAEERTLELVMGPADKVRFHVRMAIPKTSPPGPLSKVERGSANSFPVIIHNTNKLGQIPIEKEILERGYLLAEYLRTDLDPDENNVVGCAQEAYPEYDWATLAVWAWGGMRTLDYALTLDLIDKEKVAITGHSRGGKTALLAGALDERFAIVAPNGSGCGGAGCYRIQGEKSETLALITDPERFCYWFHPRFREFVGKEKQLPFDQHSLKALVAPRALISTDANDDLWANPEGTKATYQAAKPVFEFLGASEKIFAHFREGKHDQNAEDWMALINFADFVYYGKKPVVYR
jgi:hypothetical protein